MKFLNIILIFSLILLFGCSLKKMESKMNQKVDNDFYESLIKNKSIKSNSLDLFIQFISSWEWSGFDYDKNGNKTESSGKWIFETVLNGNAIQDIFIFNNPNLEMDGKRYLEYGTTLRFPNEDGKTWKAVWFAPMNKVIRIFEAKRSEEEIILSSQNEKGELVHWIFSNITKDSFHWRGEVSSDEGKTWFLYEDLDAKKII